MTTIEEQIWDYIDGNCSPAEHMAIEAKIASDIQYKTIYEEFTALNQQISIMDLDEPSMAFSRNIMEMVRLEPAPVSLKTRISNRIIYSIAAFFIAMAAAIVVYAIAESHITLSSITLSSVNTSKIDFSKIDVSHFITPTFIKVFLFADVIIGFLYLDRVLRRKNHMS